MEILKVKDNGNGGYVVNDNMYIPNEEGNRYYKLVQEWITSGEVVEPFETAEEVVIRETEEANQLVFKELEELDMASIRDIREWIVSQPTSPQTLKNREAQAVSARARIK